MSLSVSSQDTHTYSDTQFSLTSTTHLSDNMGFLLSKMMAVFGDKGETDSDDFFSYLSFLVNYVKIV